MPRFERRPLAAAVIALFSTSQFALAQQAREQTLPEVRVRGDSFRSEQTGSTTRTETPLRDIPQFINTIPEAVIRSQGVTNLQDVLRQVPGISYAAAEGGTQSNQVVYLRGFPLNQDSFIDGVRDLGEYNRDLFATESVEVVKGPSALIFGRGASGGLVNQTSKVADLLGRKEVGFQLGSLNQRRLTGDLNVKTGDASAFRVVALAEDSGHYRYPQGVEKQGIAPSLRLGIGTGTEVMLSWYYLKTRDVTDYGQPTIPAALTGTGKAGMPPVSARAYYGYANHDFTEHETNILTARIDHVINRTVSVRNTLRMAKYQRDMEATISSALVDSVTGLAPVAGTPLSRLLAVRNHDNGRTRDNNDDAVINQTDLTWRFTSGGFKHVLLTGMEISREKLNRVNYLYDANPVLAGIQTPTSRTPYLNPDPSTVLTYTRTPNQRAVATADTLAFYAQDQIEFSERWKGLLGLRWERFSADARANTIATGAVAAGPFERTDKMVSGRAGLIWQPTERQSYYASVANSFNPSGELGVYSGTANTPLTAVTQQLDPEENRNYEVGAHWGLLPGLQLRSALFRTEKINQRINNSITGVLELAGKRRVQGIEFELAGAITPRWEIYTGAAFQDGRIVRATVNQGNMPLGVAKQSGSLWSIYKLGGGWEIGGGGTASSGVNLTDANNGSTPKYLVLDATAAYVGRRHEVRLNLYNIADKLYYIGGYNNAPNRVIPGIPRSASLTVRYNFD